MTFLEILWRDPAVFYRWVTAIGLAISLVVFAILASAFAMTIRERFKS